MNLKRILALSDVTFLRWSRNRIQLWISLKRNSKWKWE